MSDSSNTVVQVFVADSLSEYLDQPSNFGSDSHEVRLAEADAFVAGWDACLDHLLKALDAAPAIMPEFYKEVGRNMAESFRATVEE